MDKIRMMVTPDDRYVPASTWILMDNPGCAGTFQYVLPFYRELVLEIAAKMLEDLEAIDSKESWIQQFDDNYYN